MKFFIEINFYFRKLRAVTYEAFTVFMRISPNNFFLKSIMENLMKEALIDVTPANKEIYLMVPQHNGGKSNKKKKVHVDKFTKGRTHIASIADEQRVCSKALECLGFLLVYHGALMKPVLFYIMQEKIVSIGFKITSKVQIDGDLYRDPHCRSRLSDVVGFLMVYPVSKMPVPINYGIALLSKIKQSDPDSNVRDCATMNIYRAETAIHNRKDVFYYPTDYKDLRDTLMFNKQTINKFNEATVAREETSTNGKYVETPEVNVDVKETEDILISDDESDQNLVKVVETVEIKSPEKEEPEINEISDEEEEEAQEISDEEPVTEMIVEPTRLTRSAERKRESLTVEPPAVAKKQKVSNKKDEELVDELLADFNG